MSFSIQMGNRQHVWTTPQVQFRLNVLNSYYSYWQRPRENLVLSIFRAIGHFFKWIQFKMIFGDDDYAALFLRQLRPQPPLAYDSKLWNTFNEVVQFEKFRFRIDAIQAPYTYIPPPQPSVVYQAPGTYYASPAYAPPRVLPPASRPPSRDVDTRIPSRSFSAAPGNVGITHTLEKRGTPGTQARQWVHPTRPDGIVPQQYPNPSRGAGARGVATDLRTHTNLGGHAAVGSRHQ